MLLLPMMMGVNAPAVPLLPPPPPARNINVMIVFILNNFVQ
jgi:hypothetical protein